MKNTLQLQTKSSTVTTVKPTAEGAEIWVAHEDGREAAYVVNEPAFRVREGQQLTAIHCGIHPVAIRNDNTRMKLPLLTGEELIGSAPEVPSRSTAFWLGWIILIAVICPVAFTFGETVLKETFGGNAFVSGVFGFTTTVFYLVAIFGVPYWAIIHPRIRRYQHNRRIKSLDQSITREFAKL